MLVAAYPAEAGHARIAWASDREQGPAQGVAARDRRHREEVKRQQALHFRRVGGCAEEQVGEPLIIVFDHASVGVQCHGSVAFLA